MLFLIEVLLISKPVLPKNGLKKQKQKQNKLPNPLLETQFKKHCDGGNQYGPHWKSFGCADPEYY
jgi:hypothetical protein